MKRTDTNQSSIFFIKSNKLSTYLSSNVGAICRSSLLFSFPCTLLRAFHHNSLGHTSVRYLTTYWYLQLNNCKVSHIESDANIIFFWITLHLFCSAICSWTPSIRIIQQQISSAHIFLHIWTALLGHFFSFFYCIVTKVESECQFFL